VAGATVVLAHVAGRPVEEVLSLALTVGGMASAGAGWRGCTSDQPAHVSRYSTVLGIGLVRTGTAPEDRQRRESSLDHN
jgi:hypothetical protein